MSGSRTVRDRALRLPRDERAGLARDLIASLDDVGDEDVDGAWIDEVARRESEVASGAVELEDWETVRERIAARLRTRET